jgi:hypothetical protein
MSTLQNIIPNADSQHNRGGIFITFEKFETAQPSLKVKVILC